MSLERREIVSLEIPADPATVWAHLRDPALVRRWHAWEHAGLEDEIRALVTSAVETRDLEGDRAVRTLTWPNHDAVTVAGSAHEPHTTRLTVTRPSHDRYSDDYDGVLDEHDERWLADAHQLRFALRVHPGQERRTLSADGLDAGTGTTGCSTAPVCTACAACRWAGTCRRDAPTARCWAGPCSTRPSTSSGSSCTGSPSRCW